jgi:hypothetical protein
MSFFASLFLCVMAGVFPDSLWYPLVTITL